MVPEVSITYERDILQVSFDPPLSDWRGASTDSVDLLSAELRQIVNQFIGHPADQTVSAYLEAALRNHIVQAVQQGRVYIPESLCGRCRLNKGDHVGADRKCPFAPTTYEAAYWW